MNEFKNIKMEQIERKDGFHITHYISDAATASNYDVIFTAIYPCEVIAVAETHRVACGSTGTLNIEKLTAGQALDAGTTILQTAYALNSTANTPIIKKGKDLVFTAGYRQLETGDRLALKDVNTLTSTAGLHVTVYFRRSGKGDYL
jgi:hypothetical protein